MNCKPGDLAIVIRGTARDRVVQVIAPYGEFLDLGFCWQVETNAPIPAIDAWTFQPCHLRTGWIPDAWLRPISGVPFIDEVLDEVTA